MMPSGQGGTPDPLAEPPPCNGQRIFQIIHEIFTEHDHALGPSWTPGLKPSPTLEGFTGKRYELWNQNGAEPSLRASYVSRFV